MAAAMRQSGENGKMMSKLLQRVNVRIPRDSVMALTTDDGGAQCSPAADANARFWLDEHGLDSVDGRSRGCLAGEFEVL